MEDITEEEIIIFGREENLREDFHIMRELLEHWNRKIEYNNTTKYHEQIKKQIKNVNQWLEDYEKADNDEGNEYTGAIYNDKYNGELDNEELNNNENENVNNENDNVE